MSIVSQNRRMLITDEGHCTEYRAHVSTQGLCLVQHQTSKHTVCRLCTWQLAASVVGMQRLRSPSSHHLPCRASVFLQSASGHSRSPALQCGTIFRPMSHQCRHSRLSDSATSLFCSLSLIRTSTPDSESLHLCGPSNN